MELTFDRLTKAYGAKAAVDCVSAQLGPGVHGLLGANGAGKTTLMRMACGVLRPTSGEVRFDGVPIERMGGGYRALLGYLPQDFGYYPEFTALDFMEYLAALKGIGRHAAREHSLELLSAVGLAGEERRRIRTFSGGMKQRLGIAQAVLNDPAVLARASTRRSACASATLLRALPRTRWCCSPRISSQTWRASPTTSSS